MPQIEQQDPHHPVYDDNAARQPCKNCGDTSPIFYPNDVAENGNQMGVPGVDMFYGHCDGCGADGPPGETMGEAIALWNKRTALPATPALQFKLAQMFTAIHELDATGALKAYLEQHGITPPLCKVESVAIDGTELVLMLDAYATDGTNGYEHHLKKIVAYIKDKRFGLSDYRVTLANTALVLYHLTGNPPSSDMFSPYGQSNLATLAAAIDDLSKRAPYIADQGLFTATAAALRFYSVGRERPANTAPFGAVHLTTLAGQIEAAIFKAAEF